jgi:ATP-dependent helicase/nuclease subunit A
MNQLTDQQTAAVAAEGNVLVMAGAGTGKTSTLVARVAERLTRPVDAIRADRLLMVTFTEAAAAEMRSRLRQRLETMAADAAGGLVEQVARLELAVIGTLHSFCLQLLREHGTQLGLEPQVGVLDGVEAGRLAAQVWGRRLETWLGAGDATGEAFRSMTEGWFDGDLSALWDTVRGVHGYLRTLADPEGWLLAQEEMWRSPTPEFWRRSLEDFLPQWRKSWVERFSGIAATQPLVEKRRSLLDAGLPPGGVGRRGWFDLLRENPAEYTKGKKTLEKEPLKLFFEQVEFLRQLEPGRPMEDPLAEDWRFCQPWMQTLLLVVREFSKSFQLEKRARGGVDFSDLEQYALDLLVRRPSGVVEWCRERFDLVVVDECQDLNAAQEAILRAVSREGARANRFLVGDVKQSIYRFRLADPRLFQATARAWSQSNGAGQVIPLTGNFRSAEGLLGFVNRVCGCLLRPEVGGVAYGPDAALEFGDPTGRTTLSVAADAGPRVEWHVRVKARSGADDAAEDPSATELSTPAAEARLIARRLRDLKESGLPVWDRRRGVLRPVEWSDMAVLLRAEKGRAEEYANEFREAGVPLVARQNGFFRIPAVSDLRNLLRILDNPLQDIPLAAVLRSPLVGLWEPDELAAVRLLNRRLERWWTLVQRFHLVGGSVGLPSATIERLPAEAEGGEDADVFLRLETAIPARKAWERIDRFINRYGEWRRLAIRSGAAAALEAALDDTGYEVWAEQAGQGGETLTNVRRFLEMARKFDRGSRGGLYRFLLWLDAEEAADRTEPAVGPQVSAVQLMTVHRSKGLEFPVVVVAGLGNRFQMADLTSARLVRDEEMGLCPLVVAPDGRRYPSVALWLAQRRQRREALGEELRLLYVALTRAADRLLLFGTATPNAVADKWAEAADRLPRPPGAMDVGDIETASSPLDWLGPVLVRDSGPEWGRSDSGHGTGFDWTLWREVPPAGVRSPDKAVETAASVGEEVADAGYPHSGATLEPAKVTATGLRRRMAEDQDGLDVGRRAFGMQHGASDPRDGTAVDRGLAHHRFLELVDPARTQDPLSLQGEIARIIAAGGMTEAETALLDVPAIERFWNSELGRMIRERSSELRREIPFTVRLTAADLRGLGFRVAPDLAPDEFVVGQGVVDLALIGPAGIVILDFKTDRVEPGRITHAKAESYRPQLAVYSLALARIHGRPVTGRWLHFLATGESVEV